jgi:hypothetical protein
MNTMSSRKESDPPECNPSAWNALRHQCPVCSRLHYVSTVRAQFAYGRQLTCSPDCEAERRRQSRASYRRAPTPIPAEPGSHGKLHLVDAHDQKAALSVTVESTDVLRVRKAVFQSGGKSVGILKVTPVPHSSRVRLFVGTRADAVDLIMTAIMGSVSACEFGRISRA